MVRVPLSDQKDFAIYSIADRDYSYFFFYHVLITGWADRSYDGSQG